MKILHFGSISKNRASGLSFSIPNLIKAQNAVSENKVGYLFNTKKKRKISRKELNDYNVIVLHSFFIPIYLWVLLIVSRKVKVIICPRGAFSQTNKYTLKKKIYSFFYFSIIKCRKLNVSIHFLTEGELTRSRFRFENDFVLGNAVKTQHASNSLSKIQRKFDQGSVVYIGRFSSHIKGLDLLFQMILQNKDLIDQNNITFKFYGPDSTDKKKLVEFAKLNNLTRVHFYEGVFGEDKDEVLKRAKFHILNSRSEGFPMSVLESSAFSTPQLLSDGTNLKNTMIDKDFGFEMDENVFFKISEISFDKYYEMSLNAYDFSLDHSLVNIGRKSLTFYFK